MNSQLPFLPVIKFNGSVRPVVIVDSREQAPLVFSRLSSIRGTLQSGDYSLVGGQSHFAVERKSVADLVGCCCGDNRERFEREMHRLRGFHFKRLLIVGSMSEVEQHKYRSAVTPQSVLGSLAAWECRFCLPVVWANTPEAAAVLVERWIWYFACEIVKTANSLIRTAEESHDEVQW